MNPQTMQTTGYEPKPVMLVLGTTGQTGSKVLAHLDETPGDYSIRICSRRQQQVDEWISNGRDAVRLDLDDPATFGPALNGVDRMFVISGYTVDMLVQIKTLVDAAIKCGVSHIVHQGVFTNWDTTDPHFIWHQLVESYIKASEIAWTHLHPNYFMENLLGLTALQNGSFPMFVNNKAVGWIALDDVAAVAVRVLCEGPQKHSGKDYWLSTDSLTGDQAAEILTDVLGQTVVCDHKTPDELVALMQGAGVEPNYAAGVVDFMRQVIDGRMAYVATIRDDVPYVTGRPSTSFRAWCQHNREALLQGI